MQHRVHWKDNVLQENKTVQNCRRSRNNQDDHKIIQDFLSDNSQRENRPPIISKRQAVVEQSETFKRSHRVLWNNYRQRKDMSSVSPSPEKARNVRYF